MARCGCMSFPTCSCIVAGDGATTTAVGSGQIIAPFLVSVIGYPKPRPYGFISRGVLGLVGGADTVISFVTNSSIPQTMWNIATPTQLLIPTTGTYIVYGGVIASGVDGWQTGEGGTRRAKLQIRKNGVSLLTSRHNGFRMPAIPVSDGGFHLTSVVRLNSGDYIELIANLAAMVDAMTSPTMMAAILCARWMGL